MQRVMRILAAALLLLLTSCSQPDTLPWKAAELLGADASWGNTEGPAIDSKGNLYFTSRGSYKGIIKWNEKAGFEKWLEVATKEGPGGLYLDNKDNLFVTATGEQQILKITPDKKVTVVAEKFDAMPGRSKGPNDLIVLPNGNIYFTAPNGYDGAAPNGTVYLIDRAGKVHVFSQELTGPNGIMASTDLKTLYVSHNTAPDTSEIVRWTLTPDGTAAGKMEVMAKVEGCQADGMDIDMRGNLWLTCYSHGTAYSISPQGKILEKVTTAQKALTNCKFSRHGGQNWLFLTSSDMERITGYIYRVRVDTPGTR